MINDIKLTSAMRNSLLNHQQIKDLTATVEKRLATGKKVNDILDGPVEYFKAKGLYDKADGLLKRKDDIDQAISTLKATQHGITNGRMIIEQVKGLAEEARNASAAQRIILEAQANKLLGEYNNLIHDTHKDGVNLLEESPVATFDGVDDRLVAPYGVPAGNDFTFRTSMNPDGDTSRQTLLSPIDSTARFDLYISNGDISLLINGSTVTANNVIDVNNYQDITMTYSGGVATVSVNGVQVISIPAAGSPTTGSGFWVGARATGGSNSFGGMMDGASMTSGGAILFDYPLIEGSGTIAYDNSGNGNDGTLGNITPADFWANSFDEDFAHNLNVDFSDDTSHLIDGVNLRSSGIGLSFLDFSSLGVDTTIDRIDAALSRMDSTAASFATDFALLQTRLEFTEDLINTHEEAGDKLTLADLEEESANRLALETREQLSLFSMTNSHQSVQNLIDILFGGGS